MTTLLAVVPRDGSNADARSVTRAVAVESLAHGIVESFADESGVIVAARAPTACSGALAVTDRVIVAADATLLYQGDVRGALKRAGVTPTGAGAAGLVAAAYEAWGEGCVDRLEGEFAFVLWDRLARRLIAARDLSGRRPLFVADGARSLIVGSSIAQILAHPGVDAALNLAVVGAEAAGLLFATGHETCYRVIRRIGAGERLRWRTGAAPVVERWWHPEPDEDAARLGFDAAAEALRELLVTAARECSDDQAPTTVWMSGGRDSTAVFAAAAEARRRFASVMPVAPLTRRYPPGDTGNEDAFVEAVASHWSVEPRWVDTTPIRMLDDAAARAARRPEPFGQPFENLTRALAAATRDGGSRVALDGHGGDFLFQVSPVYLADLVRSGRLVVAAREWRAMGAVGLHGWRTAVSWGVVPLLPRWARAAIGRVRGRYLPAPREETAPPWLEPRFVAESHLQERLDAGAIPRDGSLADAEQLWYLTHPFFGRINAMMGRLALEYGVELRSPLFDRRVVTFALSRPRDERNTAGDKKRLLRHSMRGLLPAEVLASRGPKTGTQRSFFYRGMREQVLPLLESLSRDSVLVELGIVAPRALADAIAEHRAGRTFAHTEELYSTLQAELWVRARVGRRTNRISATHASRLDEQRRPTLASLPA